MEILNYLIQFFTDYGYISVFMVLVACGCGLPVPEDITLIAGGVICALSRGVMHHHGLHLHTMVLVALAGVLIGDSAMFLLGGRLGPKVTTVPFLRRIITDKTYEQIQEKAHRYGDKILFVARFLPGLRAPIFIMAGVSHKVGYFKFIIMDGMAALISVPLLIYVGYFFANDLDRVIPWVRQSERLILVLVVTIVLLVVIFRWFKRSK
jgi:membrane protein DedA with SNARE-associated domain